MFFRIFQHLLPRSKAWFIVIQKQLREFFEGLSFVGSDVKTFLDTIYDDIDPQKTTQLDLWESEFGLQNFGLNEQSRRDRLEARWQDFGGQSPKYIQDTLQANGFNVFIHEWFQPWPNEITVSGTGTASDATYTWYGNTGASRPIYTHIPSLSQIESLVPSSNFWHIISFSTGEEWLNPDVGIKPPETGWSSGDLGGGTPILTYSAMPVTRNPLLYIRRSNTFVIYKNECGEALAQCGEADAQCGETFEPIGYPLVNKFYQTKYDTRTLCGESLMHCGESDAVCGDFISLISGRREYIVPSESEYFPYFLYFGGEIFGTTATIDLNRRDEFENLCLRLCPLQHWLGMLINYA